MVQFEVHAINAAGQQIHATIEANTADDALAQIRHTGAYPTRIRETQPPRPHPNRKSKIKNRK